MSETESTPQADAAQAAAEAAQAERAAAIDVFNNVMKDTGIQADESGRTTRVTPEAGAGETQPETQPEQEQPAQEVSDTTGDSETPQSVVELPEDFDQRLRYDNLTPTAIDALKASLDPDELVRMYRDVVKRQNRVDQLYRERNQTTRQSPEESTQEARQPEAEPSLRDLLGDKVDVLGDDVVEALDGYFNKRLESIQPVAQPDPQQGVQDARRMDAIAAEVEANRARLADTYPTARLDGPQWDFIVSQANEEAKNPYWASRYPDGAEAMQAIFDAVMYRELGMPTAAVQGGAPTSGHSQPVQNGQETTTRSGPVTRNSAATAPTSRSAPQDLSKKERERIIFDYLLRNPGDIDGARRAAGEEPLNLHPRQMRRV